MMNYKLRSLEAISSLILMNLLTSCQYKSDSKRETPNLMIIMVDDMGFSDPGCYGGEIKTPNLDYLAQNGLRFTDFHNCAKCSPTRASLLTGVYPHQANMPDIGYTLSSNVATLAEMLKQGGYQTGISGKWHLSIAKGLDDEEEMQKWVSNQIDYGDFAPLSTYPCNRGFDEHYGVIWGVVNHFDPFSLVHNEERIREIPDDFYLTDFITDKSVELIDQFAKQKNPFFLYVAYTAPHWPLQAWENDIAKYKGMYDQGWDSLRVQRYRRMVDMGLFSPETAPLAPNESGVKWDEYDHKEWEAKHMEVHAAMVDRVDQGIGKIIDELKKSGKLDNTLVLFLSDNGASPERRGKAPVFHKAKYVRSGEEMNWITTEQDTISPGPGDTWSFLGNHWAGAVNAPFRYWKGESYEGGTATPLIVHWPNGLKTNPGGITTEFGHVMDVVPTFLELAGLEYPQEFNGNKIIPYSGKSMVPIFQNKVSAPRDLVFWEYSKTKAIRDGDWKMSARKGKEWELFNMKDNRTETTDLSEKYPERVKEMSQEWDTWYEKMKEFK
jgi:arylsulfatase A-like enzyme